MNAIGTLWAQVRDEFGANPRLRLGVWAIFFILALFLVLAQEDWKAGAQAAYAAAADRLSRAERLLDQGDWNAALEQERQRNTDLTNLFWQAETPGLAEANLQAALNDMLNRLEFRNVRIRPGTSQPVEDASGLWRIQAQVNAGYIQGAELQLLHQIATHPRKLNVDSLDISRQNSRVVMIISAYFTGIAASEEE